MNLTATHLRAILAILGFLLPLGAETHARELTFEERIEAQRAIERVYYAHQIGVTRSFEEAAPRHLLEDKVRDYLMQSVVLERFWNTAVTAETLRAEMERMARRTRMPERLREHYAALGDDPFIIQECLARPLLVGRLARNFFAHDQVIHAEVGRTARTLRERLLDGWIDPWAEHPSRSVVNLGRMAPGAGSGPRAGTMHRLLDHRHEATRLELRPEEFDEWATRVRGRVGEIGPVVEERDRFVIRVALERTSDQIRMAEFVVEKKTWDDWWEETRRSLDVASLGAVDLGGGPLPRPMGLRDDGGKEDASAITAEGIAQAASASTCVENTWDNGVLDDLPAPRWSHKAVWTGSVMIVWGGDRSAPLNTGGRYDPATDSWAPTSVANAPAARSGHTAIWTGSRMIVWGGQTGSTYHNTGAQYDPITDTWTPTSTTNAPAGRWLHTGVWTGSHMIVWGGSFEEQIDKFVYLNTGGRYDPATNTWAPLSTTTAPSGRHGHAVVWTDSRMIVWGGQFGTIRVNTGGQYDPIADSWAATSTTNAASGRSGHSAVWTGTRMLVWGGDDGTALVDTGGQFDPVTNTWTAISTTGAPSPRNSHTAIWTGTQMIVWGGNGMTTYGQDTGGRYDPLADTWAPTSTTNAPVARLAHTAVWTGSRMVVWGGRALSGYLNTGGRYDPATDTWTPTSATGAPSARTEHTSIWTGSHMVVWGGRYLSTPFRTGGRYDPVTDTWTPTSVTGAPFGRSLHTAVWTGDRILVWGGSTSSSLGGQYDPLADTWMPISTVNAPEPRAYHTAVWTGSHMVVWGGYGDWPLNTGGRYDPYTDTWMPTSTTNAPSARSSHTAVWTGARMVIWGGYVCSNTGGQYDPATDTWIATSTTDAPLLRADHTAVWTGNLMVIWGGLNCDCSLQRNKGGPLPDNGCYAQDTGGRYEPMADTWTPTSTISAPPPRDLHTAIWTGSHMVVWGGSRNHNTGGRYDPVADSWTPTSITGAPSGRYSHTAVWTGAHMIVWGGEDTQPTNDGGRYCVCNVRTYYHDADDDGFGDPGASIQACGPPAGYVANSGDCNDADGAVWGTPGEAQSLLLGDSDTLSWTAPADPGGIAILYDTIRSISAADFNVGATCVASDSPAATSMDSTEPFPGSAFFYLIRAQNNCPGGGQGSLGTDSSGTPRIGRACP